MRYLILHEDTIDKAKEVSARVWEMVVPDTSQNVTKYYTGWVVHPSDGLVALRIHGEALGPPSTKPKAIPYTDALRIHPDANTDALVNSLSGAMNTAERSSLKTKLLKAKGGEASLLEISLSTPSLNQRLKTHAELQQAGWFQETQT